MDNTSILYTEAHIREHLGNKYKPITLYTNTVTDNLMYAEFDGKYLLYRSGILNILSEDKESNEKQIKVARSLSDECIPSSKVSATEYISIGNLIEYHAYHSDFNTCKLGVEDPVVLSEVVFLKAKRLLKKILDGFDNTQSKMLYILTCTMLQYEVGYTKPVKFDIDIYEEFLKDMLELCK